MRKRMHNVLVGRAGDQGAETAPPAPAQNPLAEPFSIGAVTIANRVVQAPLAGIANRVFRVQSRRHGAGATVSEMVASLGLVHGNRRTREMLTVAEGEGPVGIQLFGPNPEPMAEAARAVEAAGADFVDINMGCPVRKVCSTGAGAAMLGDPAHAARVVAAMVRAVDIPVTVKMRRGLTPDSAAPVETAQRFVDAGAAAIFLHPRAAAEEYEGTADHRITAQVAAAVSVPVIASGDIVSPQDALRVLNDTGCAAVAIGRGALGYPWLFGDLSAGVARPRPTPWEMLAEVELFAADAEQLLGEMRACSYMRKFYAWYVAGHQLPAGTVDALVRAPTLAEALACLRERVAAVAATPAAASA